MNENKNMFTQDAIDGAKCFLENKGLLSLQEIKKDYIPKQSKQNSITTNQ